MLRLQKFDINSVTKKQIKEIKEFTKYPEFQPEYALAKSAACGALLRWVICIEHISKIRFEGRIEMVDGVIGKNVYVSKPETTLQSPVAVVPEQIQVNLDRGRV